MRKSPTKSTLVASPELPPVTGEEDLAALAANLADLAAEVEAAEAADLANLANLAEVEATEAAAWEASPAFAAAEAEAAERLARLTAEAVAAGLVKTRSAGAQSMLPLRVALSRYVLAPNGQPCNGDQMAYACGTHAPAVVIKALIAALKLGSNPYAHLNVGQQSMNLRNRARNALKQGMLTIAAVEAALAAAETNGQ